MSFHTLVWLLKVPGNCQQPALPQSRSPADCIDVKGTINGIIERVGVLPQKKILYLLVKQPINELLSVHVIPRNCNHCCNGSFYKQPHPSGELSNVLFLALGQVLEFCSCCPRIPVEWHPRVKRRNHSCQPGSRLVLFLIAIVSGHSIKLLHRPANKMRRYCASSLLIRPTMFVREVWEVVFPWKTNRETTLTGTYRPCQLALLLTDNWFWATTTASAKRCLSFSFNAYLWTQEFFVWNWDWITLLAQWVVSVPEKTGAPRSATVEFRI